MAPRGVTGTVGVMAVANEMAREQDASLTTLLPTTTNGVDA